MGACLGVYLGDKLVKYAKLQQDDKTKAISVDSYGTRYVAGDKSDVIDEIISQTGSANVPMSINLIDDHRIDTEVLKQLGKSDVQSVIDLEVTDYATNQGINEKLLDYRYMLTNSMVSNDNYTANVAITDKTNITKYEANEKLKISGLYPIEFILNDLIDGNVRNSLIINIDETTHLEFISSKKLVKIVDIDISMNNILDTLAMEEGSYSKACDLCRGINVFTDEESVGQDLEKLIEPVIQDLLNRIKTKLDESKIHVEKIYLNGLINLFINIDVLFEQFFNVDTEKLKPSFINIQDTSANVAEIMESNEAIALAYECITNQNEDMNFVAKKKKAAPSFNFSQLQFWKKKDAQPNSSTIKKTLVLPNINKEKVETALLFANIVAGAAFIGYGAFGAIYNAEINRIVDKSNAKTSELQLATDTVRQDVQYIQTNANKYAEVNTYISETVEKIREGKIGKYTTYNVANFMQKIAKYIPANVQLETISSDDNKSVTITAKSTSYAELGYFISQLKLKGILENVATGKVEHGDSIKVTIGGDLP